MKVFPFLSSAWRTAPAMLAAAFLGIAGADAATTTNVVFSTGFEPGEGYDAEFELIGQQGWVGEGTGGTGLLDDATTGDTQWAYIGFFPPTQPQEQFTSVWQPLQFSPLEADTPVVVFSTFIEIVDSTNGKRDDFRWSVYNRDAQRLFSLDFDNSTTGICFLLDDGQGFRETDFLFENNVVYHLTITMDFARNRWSADLADVRVVEEQPLTTTQAALNLGDIGAVWFIFDPDLPGDNFMRFDDYHVTAHSFDDSPPTVEIVSREESGDTLVRLTGEPGGTYSLEASSDLAGWVTLETATATGGTIEYLDTEAGTATRRFYRGRRLP